MAKIGIVGTGWGARVQVPTFREAGLEVVAIAGSQPEKTRKTADDLGSLTAYDDWRELVTSDVDLVSIVTPPSEHRAMALAALEAGKHVLCEKPTALDAGEAEALVDAARQRPSQLALIDHELCFLPSWRDARARIGTIGAPRYAEVRYASPARNDPKRAWNWWSDAAQGGGIWGAVGSHFIDALRYFGLEIEAVQAMLRSLIAQRPFGDDLREVTADDFAAIHLRFRGGAAGALTISTVSSAPDDAATITIHGEHGAMRFVGEEVFLSRNQQPYERIGGGPLEQRPGNSPGGAFGTGTLHLGRALRAALDDGDRDALAPAATFEDGLAQQRVLDAARRSASSGGWISL
ncbi:MAG: Gfo/Idh/MocA family oxidoreductase [Acidobacteria bacterium]|nr:Gfo/Idh/MocA family oxidoreductase [Acidobacteriota bacterium]MBV9476706.1 Gfo/Idh/MocA family oxidoreductase [Acidobacteriota bacterium]